MQYGASVVIDAGSSDVVTQVERITDGLGADIVFEGPGAETWERSMRAVSQGGKVVTAGVTSGHMANLDIEDLYYRQISILGSRMGYDNEFTSALAGFAEGKMRPLMAGVMGLSEAQTAHAKAAAGDRCGKIVMMYDL
jgi:NADPH2:quinone reductase